MLVKCPDTKAVHLFDSQDGSDSITEPWDWAVFISDNSFSLVLKITEIKRKMFSREKSYNFWAQRILMSLFEGRTDASKFENPSWAMRASDIAKTIHVSWQGTSGDLRKDGCFYIVCREGRIVWNTCMKNTWHYC